MISPLPVDAVIPELIAALQNHRAAVLLAPPGSGKTTRAPAALLDAGLAGDGRVVVLQPRRVAARLTAQRIAWERGSKPGEEVGWRVRFDNRTSAQTRLEVLTEGLLTRRLQSDPFLDGVGLVVLDEFHERSLQCDLALGMLAEVQEARPDLRVLVMSATLDPQPIVRFFDGDCPVIEAGGRPFPVEIRHVDRPDSRRLEDQCARLVHQALRDQDSGHVLVFLPGVGEIERVRGLLDALSVPVLPLHGRLSADAQDAALAPSRQRKVVLATNIAETSVTLEGVRAVVDTGMRRTPQFDPVLGLSRLQQRPISKASAAQRAGRAGRTGPGVCYRMWTQRQHVLRNEQDAPSIRHAALDRVVLEVLAWCGDVSAFRWLDSPPEAHLQQALALLEQLGAIAQGQLTDVGRQLCQLPVTPRLGRVVLAGHAMGCLRAAATAAALVSERDPWSHSAVDDGLLARLDWVEQRGNKPDRRALAVVCRVRDQLIGAAKSVLGPAPRHREQDDTAILDALIAGFPDRVAQQRSTNGRRYLMAGGKGAVLDERLAPSPLLIAADLTAGEAGRDSVIRMAATLHRTQLVSQPHDVLFFDTDRKAVVCETQQRYGALVLGRRPASHTPDPQAVADLLAEAACARIDEAFNIPPAVRAWQARASWLAHNLPELGLVDVRDIRPFIPQWCLGHRSFADLWMMDVLGALRTLMTWQQQVVLDREAPERIEVPSGSRVRLFYAEPELPPILPARIQQLFGMKQAPKIAGGRVTVRVHLLAPNNRPMQITSDLESFWANTYAQVRKDLRGRYPHHAWPEHPTAADAQDRPTRKKRR